MSTSPSWRAAAESNISSQRFLITLDFMTTFNLEPAKAIIL